MGIDDLSQIKYNNKIKQTFVITCEHKIKYKNDDINFDYKSTTLYDKFLYYNEYFGDIKIITSILCLILLLFMFMPGLFICISNDVSALCYTFQIHLTNTCALSVIVLFVLFVIYISYNPCKPNFHDPSNWVNKYNCLCCKKFRNSYGQEISVTTKTYNETATDIPISPSNQSSITKYKHRYKQTLHSSNYDDYDVSLELTTILSIIAILSAIFITIETLRYHHYAVTDANTTIQMDEEKIKMKTKLDTNHSTSNVLPDMKQTRSHSVEDEDDINQNKKWSDYVTLNCNLYYLHRCQPKIFYNSPHIRFVTSTYAIDCITVECDRVKPMDSNSIVDHSVFGRDFEIMWTYYTPKLAQRSKSPLSSNTMDKQLSVQSRKQKSAEHDGDQTDSFNQMPRSPSISNFTLIESPMDGRSTLQVEAHFILFKNDMYQQQQEEEEEAAFITSDNDDDDESQEEMVSSLLCITAPKNSNDNSINTLRRMIILIDASLIALPF